MRYPILKNSQLFWTVQAWLLLLCLCHAQIIGSAALEEPSPQVTQGQTILGPTRSITVPATTNSVGRHDLGNIFSQNVVVLGIAVIAPAISVPSKFTS